MRQHMRVLIAVGSVALIVHTFGVLLTLISRESARSASKVLAFEEDADDLEILNSSTIAQDDPRLVSIVSSRESVQSASKVHGLQDGADDLEILNSSTIAQDDPRLVSIVRRMLLPPSQKPYNFTNSRLNARKLKMDPSAGQSQAVKDILTGFGSKGFFLDCGAHDGEWFTNTIWVERNLGWNGILIEADPRPYKKLLAKNRKAYVGNFCLSNTSHPQIVPFYLGGKVRGYLSGKTLGLASSLIRRKDFHATRPVQAQCFPLYTVMLAVGRTTVDFFSLDVEGKEIEILRTLPKDAIFKVITVEHTLLKEGKLGLRDFMTERGYTFYGTVESEKLISGDSIFIHNSVVPTLTDEQRAKFGFDNHYDVRRPRN